MKDKDAKEFSSFRDNKAKKTYNDIPQDRKVTENKSDQKNLREVIEENPNGDNQHKRVRNNNRDRGNRGKKGGEHGGEQRDQRDY